MSERFEDQSPLPEMPEILSLQYPQGWRDILTAPDAADYQLWMSELTRLTHEAFQEVPEVPSWAKDTAAIMNRWQRAVEIVADAAIDIEDNLTEAERIETALLTVQANVVEGMGWAEEGLAFIVPNLITGEEASIDLRDLAAMPDTDD